MERVEYSEFAYLPDNAGEVGLPWDGPPAVRREAVDLGDGRSLSALVWGTEPPELVLLHGGAQNAHTWDTVALALGRPLVAIDLPGHGHSDAGRRGSLDVHANADDVAAAVRVLAPEAAAVVGMSLGGLTALALAAGHPALVRSVVLVDITPQPSSAAGTAAIHAFVDGPESFPSFEEILARTIEFNPTRSEISLRRGILHNALQREDGSWVWRYARFRAEDAAAAEAAGVAAPSVEEEAGDDLWDAVGGLTVPLMLVRGMRAGSVLQDEDEAELLRRQPGARIEHVAEAGHSIQGDQPLELARLLEDFVPRS